MLLLEIVTTRKKIAMNTFSINSFSIKFIFFKIISLKHVLKNCIKFNKIDYKK